MQTLDGAVIYGPVLRASLTSTSGASSRVAIRCGAHVQVTTEEVFGWRDGSLSGSDLLYIQEGKKQPRGDEQLTEQEE